MSNELQETDKIDYDKSMELVHFQHLENLSQADIEAYIAQSAELMVNSGQGIDLPVKHHFSKGVYGREMFIPKGTYVVGKIHKFENFNILSQGEISVISIEGIRRFKAPFSMVSPPGVRRFVYAHEDCVWTTIHGTDETDVEKIEEIFIAKNYEEVIYKDANKEIE